MTNQPPPQDRSPKLLLIDDDPIFRLGLSAALEAYPDLQIIAQADTSAIPEGLTWQPPDIVVLDPGIGLTLTELTLLQQWQQLKNKYPETPILLLSANPPPQNLQSFGIGGYCPKGTAVDELVTAIRQVAAGETYWQLPAISPERRSPRRRRRWFARMGHSGVKQIDREMAAVERHLQNSQLPLFDWLYWSGRKRELLSARWLVSQLLPIEEAPVFASTEAPPPVLRVSEPAASLAPTPSGSLAKFDDTLSKIQLSISNLTGVPFEIEILQQQKQQELLYLILNQIEKILAEMRFLQITPEQLPEKIPLILRELWQTSTVEFLSRNALPADVNQINLADILLREAFFVEGDILSKIPFAIELFNNLLFDSDRIKNIRPLEAPEDLEEILLQNLTIQEANAVMQTILNNFAGVEELKRTLYRDRFISSRDMARFRNNLSWKYRQEKYFEDPKNIFESKYRLFYFSSNGIRKFVVYSPRQEELNHLSGIPWAVTIALEVRDAIAPRLQALVDFVGRGVVYVLTEVIGKGIGLIGRGVILGIGNVLQETRYRKNSERGKQ